MRILILSANTGEGHNSTAKAVMEVLQGQGAICDLQDTLAFLSPGFSRFISAWHVRLYKYGGRLFDAGYRAMERGADPEESPPIYELLSFGASKLHALVRTGGYDAVICVHAFAGMMMTEVRRVWDVSVPCFFIATDYTCSPTVEQCDMDVYFTPAAALAGEFVRAGLNSSKLVASGIPVRQEFYSSADKSVARVALQLPEKGQVALLMCGSMGCGPIPKIAKGVASELPDDTTLVAVCGNNEKLRATLLELELPRTRVLGFTGELSTYMDAADLIITKPGGLSSTEAANKHLPMVLINVVGGCESRNFDYFLSKGFALGSDDADTVISQTLQLLRSPADRDAIRQTLQEQFTVNSTQLIAQRVLSAATAHREGIQRISAGFSGEVSPERQDKATLYHLAHSFSEEAQAHTRYTVYARVAREEGQERIAGIFEAIAGHKSVHAELFLRQLQKLGGCADSIPIQASYPFRLGTTGENLGFAAAAELRDQERTYAEFAALARSEQAEEAAQLWERLAQVQRSHHSTLRQLYEQQLLGTLEQSEAPVLRRCLHCGYTYESTRPCNPCPVCGKSAGWQTADFN